MTRAMPCRHERAFNRDGKVWRIEEAKAWTEVDRLRSELLHLSIAVPYV